MQGRSGRFVYIKITLFHRCHQRHTLASHRVAVTIIFLLHLMSLTDILGFDLAVRCHLLSLALPGACFLFHFLFPASSLSRSSPPLHYPLSIPFFLSSALYVSSFSTSFSQPPFLCLSPGWRKEALQEIHLQRRGTVQQNTNDIFTWRRGRNRRDGFTRERFIERYAKGRRGGGET